MDTSPLGSLYRYAPEAKRQTYVSHEYQAGKILQTIFQKFLPGKLSPSTLCIALADNARDKDNPKEGVDGVSCVG